MIRFVRKHGDALLAVAAFNFVIFFPLLFMGRVVSPNDVFFNFDPWGLYRPDAVPQAQNAILNDPPTSWLTLISMLKTQPDTLHWNPWIASGVPGWGSSASAVLSPFILLSALLPLTWVYTAMIFLKFNVAYLFAYLWLREERIGRRGAAVGAIVIAGAGVYAVRWLWQMTNATALYPALLWLVRRTFAGRRVPFWLATLVALSYALAGFPSSMAYGAYIAIAYAIFLAIRFRRLPFRGVAVGVGAAITALLIAAPSLIPFVQFVRRSGYLTMRDKLAEVFFPLEHWRMFFDPLTLGSHASKSWVGDPRLQVLNNFVEATVYLGLLTIPLVLLSLLARRVKTRWFWIAAAVVILCAMFGLAGVPRLFAQLPGFKYTALARLASLLPLPAGFLAACGVAWIASRLRRVDVRTVVTAAIAILIAGDLALFAGRFYPYLRPADAVIPSTPTIDYLRAQAGPFRVAPLLNYLWPNSSEMFRIEDVRSHFSSEADYRRLLLRVDPTSWSGTSTMLQLNSLKLDYNDPILGLLGIRYFVEHKAIDIVKWTTFAATTPGVQEAGALQLRPNAVFERAIAVDAEPFWAIELPGSVTAEWGANARLLVELLKDGRVVWSRAFAASDINVMNKMYVPLRRYAKLGETVSLRVTSLGIEGSLLRASDGQLFYGRVGVPVVFDRELPDGRLFLNLSELPRFRAVSRVRKMNDDEFLALRAIDFANEAVITDDPVMPPDVPATEARVKLVSSMPAEHRIATESSAPFYLASSEKLTPELLVTIDGRRAKAIETDLLFAGVVVPAGKHEIVYSRQLARGWWWLAGLGVAMFALVGAADVIASRRRG